MRDLENASTQTSSILLAAMLVVSGACASEPSKPPKPLCDPLTPTSGLVAVEQRVPVERVAQGQAVMFDNGGLYMFVDARCNYWVSNPSERWAETRTGVLDAASALELGERLHFGAWDDLRGVWSDPSGGIYDAPMLVFDNSKNAVLCVFLCGAPDVPAVVKAMRDEYALVEQELWDRGEPVVSGVHAIAVASEPGPGVPFVDWPLSRPISDFVRADAFIGLGEGTLEDDPVSAQALKELRASFLRGDHGAFGWDMLPVVSDGAYYRLYLRDVLPFEDERGLVPLSVEVD